MNKSNNEESKKVLDTQESASENEESDSVTDQSSSMSEITAQRQKNGKAKTSSGTKTATQFSVQRSDVDGLRMKISAIRPTTTTTAAANKNTSNLETKLHVKVKSAHIGDKFNNNTIDNVKAKISNKAQEQHNKLENRQSTVQMQLEEQKSSQVTRMAVDIASNASTTDKTSAAGDLSGIANSSDKSLNSANTKNTTLTSNHISSLRTKADKLTTIPAPPIFSDATESGCSEATTTTVTTANNEKSTKKIRIKRKKPSSFKLSDGNKLISKLQHESAFSSDTDDELLKKQQPRAPRLLLTAINAKSPALHINLLSTKASPVHGSDHIGLSSSDNDLPDLVSAAIKRVESDADDALEGFRRAKTRNLPQYQSTLLQDFMEKTQMLGQTPVRVTSPLHSLQKNCSELSNLVSATQSSNITTNSVKKRRGRPKKVATISTDATTTALAVSTINESADSGVISTSTTQSTSPLPKLTTSSSAESPKHLVKRQRKTELNEKQLGSPIKSLSNEVIATTSAAILKPKIDIAYLDKRMYATERVLYPPPRNKRRQSTATSLQKSSQGDKKSNTSTKMTKDELQLDPVWRQIDVNKKFRRPSVSGYKSDGGGGNTTICSKILAAKSGYVSDYGSFHPRSHHHHNSGYKSDASCKSRYSVKSCASRRSRAKSCGYRSDFKESSTIVKSNKIRRKRRCSLMKTHSKSVGNLTDVQDILQLAGLSLGQSSEESNEYVCKPNLENLPTTSVSKKYGEINRFITTGQYFGRGNTSVATFGSLNKKNIYDEDGSQDVLPISFRKKSLLRRKNSLVSEFGHDLLPNPTRRIKSRRSSVASYCSSYISGISKVKRRRKHKIFRYSSSNKSVITDSKLSTDIDIIINTFQAMCSIQINDKNNVMLGNREKLLLDTNKLHVYSSVGSGNKRESRDKRSMKKRKMSENHEYALLSASCSNLTTSGSSKRRHKKASSSSPDDHKLPLKKRHYLLTPGEKSTEAAVAKLFASTAEAWPRSSSSTKSLQAYSTKSSKAGLTPKKRHLLQTGNHLDETTSGKSLSSPLRIVVENSSISGGKLLDISPHSLSSLRQSTEAVHKKRTRLEGLVSKIANHTDEHSKESVRNTSKSAITAAQLDSEASCPPPGIFEPSVELEIQIPPIVKLNEVAAGFITKSEVDSPLMLELNKVFPSITSTEPNRVVESLLNKTGANLLYKRKRKKINRTGFPTVRRKKRKINENLLLDVTPDVSEEVQSCIEDTPKPITGTLLQTKSSTTDATCDRVPQVGEDSNTFLERANRTPRLSVVALERLQSNPMANTSLNVSTGSVSTLNKDKKKKLSGNVKQEVKEDIVSTNIKKKKKLNKNQEPFETIAVLKENKNVSKDGRGRKPKNNTLTNDISNKKVNPLVEEQKLLKGLKVVPKIEKLQNKMPISLKNSKPNIITQTGIDPKVKNCKVRIKRPGDSRIFSKPKKSNTVSEVVRSDEEITAEAAAKDILSLEIEHDVLPMIDCNYLNLEGTSDTSEEKSTSVTNNSRKFIRIRKNYLPAGLFSDFFKKEVTEALKKNYEKSANDSQLLDSNIIAKPTSLLPPPPYCEKYLRRLQRDFELPFDVWWAYKNSKLPIRNTVPSWNYRKIRVNIYADSVRPNLAGFDHPTCNCKHDIGCGDNCLNRLVYTECSPSSCPTREKCHNQRIQRHEVAPGVERFMTDNKGWGVRTKLPIQKGTYILEYVGEVVTEREFKDRMGTIYLNDNHHYCLHLDGGLVIDGHRMGSDGRFVNHSCLPNCEMQKWSVNGLSRMALFAKRDVEEGEELTYDYNFALFNPSEGQPCRCNTPQCRGVIGGKSQRIKPLPIEAKPIEPNSVKDGQKCRQRKRKARKNAQRLHSKDIVLTRTQHLSEKEKKMVMQYKIFLIRNYEKIRRCRAKQNLNDMKTSANIALPTSSTSSVDVSNRRPSTPPSLAAQISALCSNRNIKTRGLSVAVQDPELEKMAKMAVILRDICAGLENIPDPQSETTMLIQLLTTSITGISGKKKKAAKNSLKQEAISLKKVQCNIEQGFYKEPSEFDNDMQKLFENSKKLFHKDDTKLNALNTLISEYENIKQEHYKHLLELNFVENELKNFRPSNFETKDEIESSIDMKITDETNLTLLSTASDKETSTNNEDIIRCICGLYKDEGLMIQCARCMVWQHTECTKADINADHYMCEKCEPREVNREIPLEDFTEDGHRYYLSLMRGALQVRQGDAVYVLRDIPIKDADGNIVPKKKHTYETIGNIDYNECDIFRVERLWKNEVGKRFIFGHHFLRPHETFHEPSRRFYPNEVVRVPLYEVVPIELVIGRCWVLDRTTFCKGRPMECVSEDHCYICELRVDKTARFFSKAKVNYPICTKNYAFKKFTEKLKISKTYAPHEVDPTMLKSKKQKNEIESTLSSASLISSLSSRDTNKTPQSTRKKCGGVHLFKPIPPTQQSQIKKETKLSSCDSKFGNQICFVLENFFRILKFTIHLYLHAQIYY
ncbi:histone-lysine N-methyltransferase ash1 isoform X2 [Teleopsis dalmanni]|uniref:histone-lysine N-methyltransferase ash1 isoform X2 n=1 Tax=Teleopsis dalmanni TaxID=139649 RepID=UPI0018CF8CE7|nr:histone-lysine N-methyltransferase ash1 isoform X2 [Teleopsis dalmanni]